MRAMTVRQVAQTAKHASRVLAPLDARTRNAALEAMAAALTAARDELLEANAQDMHIAVTMQAVGELTAATLDRLKLDDVKLAEMIAQIHAVAALPDPLGRTLDAVELDDADPQPGSARGLHLQKISVPLGVLAVIFEARPDAVTQIASLALKSGNAVVLKAGREVEHTAAALVRVLRQALAAASLPPRCRVAHHGSRAGGRAARAA